MKIAHLSIIFIVDHVLFKKSERSLNGNRRCAVEWPVKNCSVITKRDQNFFESRGFAYQHDAVKYEFIVCGHDFWVETFSFE